MKKLSSLLQNGKLTDNIMKTMSNFLQNGKQGIQGIKCEDDLGKKFM